MNERGDTTDDLVLPLAEERAVITKHVVETGRVKVTTHVEKRIAPIHETLRHQDVIVERVAVDRVVESVPEPRLDGEVLVYPVVEEILVVEKRFVLKEEIRISRKTRVEVIEREVTLRSVHADVERTPADSD